ncbi:MAG TPA: acetolactate synthase small subunit [Caldilineaceae bacterium]|nr:acetolactate synthase small subunit [Caldilineaceae bacterium]
MKHTLIAWMRDKPGVLNQVAGLIRRRNFNIDSLQVGHSETPGISRMTFVVNGDERMVDQVIKQLRKLVDVTRVDNISGKPAVMHELAMIRVEASSETRGEVIQLVNIHGAQVVDVSLDSLIIQIVATEEKVNALLGLMRHFGIQEMVRTGRVAMVRSSEPWSPPVSTVWRAQANGAEAATATDLFSTSGV